MADEKEPLTKAMDRGMEKDENKPKMNYWEEDDLLHCDYSSNDCNCSATSNSIWKKGCVNNFSPSIYDQFK